MDFAVVCITFIIVITATTGAGQWAENFSILTVIRFVRLVSIQKKTLKLKQNIHYKPTFRTSLHVNYGSTSFGVFKGGIQN